MPPSKLATYGLELLFDIDDLLAGRTMGWTRRALHRELRRFEVALDQLDPRVPELGIHLDRHYEDIRRLTSWRAGALCHRRGWDIEDLISEVIVGVAVRNQGICPWDRRKGSLSHYIVLVINGVVANRIRRAERRPVLVADHIVVDDEEVVLEPETEPVDMEAQLDVTNRWATVRDEHPEIVDALVDSTGTIRPVARELGLPFQQIREVRMRLVSP